MAEQLGAGIEVVKNPDQGITFTVTIPDPIAAGERSLAALEL
jgi:signal transduction histidine kinase